jgi:hypothetical protein
MENPAVFIILILVAIAIDMFSSLSWWPPYFRIGLPLFVRSAPLPQVSPVLPGSAELAERFSGSWVIPILFKRLSSNEIAVRESFWGGFFKITYTPLVHGLLEADPLARKVKIVGRANVFPFVFLAFFAVPLSIDMSSRDPVAIPFLVVLVGSLLSVQYVRYGKVLQHALRLMEKTIGSA